MVVTAPTFQQDFDMLLLKYDSDGNLLWDRTLDNGDGQLDSAYRMSIDPDGNAILAGYTEPNAYLAKYSPTGPPPTTTTRWRRGEGKRVVGPLASKPRKRLQRRQVDAEPDLEAPQHGSGVANEEAIHADVTIRHVDQRHARVDVAFVHDVREDQ